MVQLFKEQIYHLVGHNIVSDGVAPRFLLAVSGGIDSMCMATMFSEAGLNFAIAHVNFMLRGDESDGDEILVKHWCEEREVKFYSLRCDTKMYAKERGLSTQMAAREIRYNFFERVSKEHGFQYISVAHNLNDSAETLFINLLRGTGIDGITGIKPKNGKIIRPLLIFTRDQIVEYCTANSVKYREDRTNKKDDYARNRIRNRVFPEFSKINENFIHSLEKSMDNFRSAISALDEIRDNLLKQHACCQNDNGAILSVALSAFMGKSNPEFWLYRIIEEYGFNYSQCRDVIRSLESESGKEFYSRSHYLLKDRDKIFVFSCNGSCESKDYEIVITDAGSIALGEGKSLIIEVIDRYEGFSPIRDDNSVIYADAESASFPLIVRNWRAGDKMRPLGMKGFKKLSDIFTDIKLDLASKKGMPVVTKNGQIVCLPGFRSDDRFKITEKSNKILVISIC